MLTVQIFLGLYRRPGDWLRKSYIRCIMARSFLIPASLFLSWMFSPEALVLSGNSFGRGGLMFLVPLAIAAILSGLCIALIHHPSLPSSCKPFSILASEIGTLPAMTLTLAGRLSLVLLLPTGMLVTAGFTFNETFVYWFPNFAFAFLLLGLVLLLHLAGERIALAVQPIFIGLTIGCLLLLCLSGLTGPGEIEVTPAILGNESPFPSALFCGALLLFLGYDRLEHSLFSAPRSYYIWALLLGFIILALWGTASIKHVPLTKLSTSTIPYIISAREILGQPGRIIMGVAVISGVCGIVNSLFLIAASSIQHIAEHVLLPSLPGPRARNQRICSVLFSLLIGVFMAAGLAGSENLDAYIYGALLLWLVTIGVQCFAAARRLATTQIASSLYRYSLSAVFPLAAVWLACAHAHAVTLFVFCFLVLVTSAVFSACWLWLFERTANKKINKQQGDVS